MWTGSRYYRGICWPPHLTGKCGRRPFYGGSGRRAVAHTRPAFPKNAYGPLGIPLIRGAGQWTQTLLREWKPEGKAPWGFRKSPGTETHSARSAPRQHGQPNCNPAPGEVQSEINLSPEWCEPGLDSSGVFVARPTLRASVAQGLFFAGSGCRAVAHTRPADSSGLSGIISYCYI